MLPLRDDVPRRSVAVVTAGLIVLNALVFLYQMSLGAGESTRGAGAIQAFLLEFGMIPCRLSGLCRPPGDLPPPALTLVTSMFLHGGLFHVVGNMLYLWIFGKSVEQTLGHGRYLVFYMTAGVGAALGQTLASPGSIVPMVGASGAVSGVLGAYLLLFPHAHVMTLVVLGFFVRVVPVPAVIVLGVWIIVQFVNGLVAARTGMGTGVEAAGGVAWFAHLGGVAAGMLLLLVLRPRASRRAR